jgi:hypothetical protein
LLTIHSPQILWGILFAIGQDLDLECDAFCPFFTTLNQIVKLKLSSSCSNRNGGALMLTANPGPETAKAIFKFQVASARRRIEQIDFDTAEINEFVSHIRQDSLPAQVLTLYSYLDDKIQTILSVQMRYLESQNARSRIFGPRGPLSNFSSRVLVAYHLGWLSNRQRLRLDAFRKLQNVFAQRAFEVSLTDNYVADQLRIIDYGSTGIFERTKESADDHFFSPNLLCNLIVLTIHTIYELIVLPIALIHHLDPKLLVIPREKQPVLLERVESALIGALLIAGTTQ